MRVLYLVMTDVTVVGASVLATGVLPETAAAAFSADTTAAVADAARVSVVEGNVMVT